MVSHNFQSADIYNCDETGCSSPKTQRSRYQQREKQVGKKGWQLGSRQERRGTCVVRVAYTVSAAGNALPSMLIFRKVNYYDHFIREAFPDQLVKQQVRVGQMKTNL